MGYASLELVLDVWWYVEDQSRLKKLILYRKTVVSDGVVIWRVWVLYPEQRWVMIGPMVLWLGTLGRQEYPSFEIY